MEISRDFPFHNSHTGTSHTYGLSEMIMDKRIIFRIPDMMHEEVNNAVRDGKAKTVSELIRKALKEFLNESNN